MEWKACAVYNEVWFVDLNLQYYYFNVFRKNPCSDLLLKNRGAQLPNSIIYQHIKIKNNPRQPKTNPIPIRTGTCNL